MQEALDLSFDRLLVVMMMMMMMMTIYSPFFLFKMQFVSQF